MALKESVAITLSTNCDLAIECLGVRVTTIDVKMMKRKFATSEFSNVDSSTPILLAMLHRMVFVRPCSRRRSVRVCVVDLKSFRTRIGPSCRSSSLDASKMVFPYRFRWCQVAL